jgi:hypothetical protein
MSKRQSVVDSLSYFHGIAMPVMHIRQQAVESENDEDYIVIDK